jgi:hypothetical protein
MEQHWIQQHIATFENNHNKRDVVTNICHLHTCRDSVSDTARFMLRIIILCYGTEYEPLVTEWNRLVRNVAYYPFEKWLSNFICHNLFTPTRSMERLQIAKVLLHLSPNDLSKVEVHHPELLYVILRLYLALDEFFSAYSVKEHD